MKRKVFISILLLIFSVFKSVVSQDAPLKIGEITFSENSILNTRELIKLSGIRKYNTFSLLHIEEGVEKIIGWYEENGYPYCKISLNKIDNKKLTGSVPRILDVSFNVAEGRKVFIDSIVIKGNKTSRRRLIIRESGITEGSLFSQSGLNDAFESLSKLSYISEVNTVELISFFNNKNGILVDLTENSMSRFQGIFGYSPGAGKEKGYFIGSFNIGLQNLFGTGRAFSAYWEKKDRDSEDINLSYFEPWILGMPLHLNLGINQIIQDSTYVKRMFNIEVEYKINKNFSTFLSFKNESTYPDQYGKENYGLYKMMSFFISSGLKYDTEDNIYNPTKGIKYLSSFSMGRRNNLENRDNSPFTEKNFDVLLEIVLPLRGNNLFFLKGYGAKITSSDRFIPYSQLLTLGGAKSLRGYRERQFRSSFTGIMTVEYRYVLSRLSRMFLFVDTGFFQNENLESKPVINRSGYGWGMKFETRLGLVGFNYGLGRGDTLMRGKFHFTLENKF